MKLEEMIIKPDDLILVTGATGFIGAAVVESLVSRGFRNLRCFVRVSSNLKRIDEIVNRHRSAQIQVLTGNLLSREDCTNATKGVTVTYHLAAGTGEKSFPDAFMNSVVSTRNLLDASRHHGCLRRFLNISSFAVYTNRLKSRWRVLDESSSIEKQAELRGEAYCFAKVKQDEIVMEYGKEHRIPYVIIRPGVVYGPGKKRLTGRVGIGTFGVFLHLGGFNTIPLTYVDNCAEAIVLAGVRKGVDGEIFNVVDDDLPSSRQILRLYKRNVKSFKSIYVPHFISYLLFYAWEKYSKWSNQQLPPVYNRLAWHAYWKGSRYSNEKLKRLLGWAPKISTREGLERYLKNCREGEQGA